MAGHHDHQQPAVRHCTRTSTPGRRACCASGNINVTVPCSPFLRPGQEVFLIIGNQLAAADAFTAPTNAPSFTYADLQPTGGPVPRADSRGWHREPHRRSRRRRRRMYCRPAGTGDVMETSIAMPGSSWAEAEPGLPERGVRAPARIACRAPKSRRTPRPAPSWTSARRTARLYDVAAGDRRALRSCSG